MCFLASYFAQTIEVLYVTLGFGIGFANNLVLLVGFTIIPHYFDKQRGMALGITQAGNGIGMFIFFPLNGYLVSTYGLQGSFLLLAAISLHTIPLGLLIKEPLHEQSQDANLKADVQELHSMPQNYETLGDNNKITDSDSEAYKEELVANSETTSGNTKCNLTLAISALCHNNYTSLIC